RPADPLELPILEHAEQLRLRLEGQLADLVEEERAAVGQLEAADAPRVGPREGALLVPEQLALDERRRERGAVALDERAVPPRAPAVQRAREDALAGPRLSGDEHGRVDLRERHQTVDRAAERR